MRVRPHLVPLLVLPALVVVATGAAVTTGRPDHRRAYTVAEVRAHLAFDPGNWVGRTVRLRATAEHCLVWGSPSMGMHCLNLQPVLVDREGSLADSLQLTWRQQGALLALVRGVPLLGELVPAPQALHWGARAPYRVQLRAAAGCGYPPCYEALLDAAPESP